MVHALEIAHSLLKPGGLLIDIHPTGQPPPIEVHVDGRVRLAGYLDEMDGFVEYFQADDALANMIERGWFILEREGRFINQIHTPTIEELAEYLEAAWLDSELHEETAERAKLLIGEPGEDREIVLRESVRITRLRANTKQDL